MNHNSKFKKVVKLWLLPLIISAGLFVVIRPALAQLSPEQQQTLSDYVKDHNVEVGTELKDGFRQIYYVYNGEKVFITTTNYTSANPITEREYVAWQSQIDSGWRIFLYHIPSGTTTQLTDFGINVNPRISGNKVVWEGQDNGVWQVYLFDGIRVSQITSGDMSLNPEIEGDFIVYGRKDLAGWRASIYSLIEKKEKDIITGELAQDPKLNNGKILIRNISGKVEEFNLNPQDLFTLDLAPLTVDVPDVPETVTIEEILEELEAEPVATESGALEEILPTTAMEFSPSPTLTLSPEVSLSPTPDLSPSRTISPSPTIPPQ